MDNLIVLIVLEADYQELIPVEGMYGKNDKESRAKYCELLSIDAKNHNMELVGMILSARRLQ